MACDVKNKWLKTTYRLAPPAWLSRIGRGSVGWEILCFLPPERLGLGSKLVEGAFEVDTLRLNHFEGFVKNWVNPDEGEAERGKGTGPFGDNRSGGGSVFPRLGAILVVESWIRVVLKVGLCDLCRQLSATTRNAKQHVPSRYIQGQPKHPSWTTWFKNFKIK